MNISPTKYNYNYSMTSKNSNKTTDAKKEYLNIGKTKVPYTPATIGISNGILWFGVNVLFDRLFSLITGSKNSLKSSVIFSGLIGAGFGSYAYIKAKKDFAEKARQQ